MEVFKDEGRKGEYDRCVERWERLYGDGAARRGKDLGGGWERQREKEGERARGNGRARVRARWGVRARARG